MSTGQSIEQAFNLEAIQYMKLRGRYRHYCPDWDYMAIDETCPEWQACLCYKTKLRAPWPAMWVILTSFGLAALIWIVVLAVANYFFKMDLLPL